MRWAVRQARTALRLSFAILCAALVPAGACEQLLPPKVDLAAGTEADAAVSGALSRASHGTNFPIDTGTFHADLACGDCHDDASTFTTFTCTSCHAHASDVAAARHISITGYEWDSKACRNCHPAGQEAVISPQDHSAKYFPISSGNHRGLACSDCHQFKTTSKTFTCTTCHAQDETFTKEHASVPQVTYGSFSCYGCHPKG